jgi:hypothetical protein
MLDSNNWAYELNSRRKERELVERLKKKLPATPYFFKANERTTYFFSTEEKMNKFKTNSNETI